MACGILVPQPVIEPTAPEVEAESLKHQADGKVLKIFLNEGKKPKVDYVEYMIQDVK